MEELRYLFSEVGQARRAVEDYRRERLQSIELDAQPTLVKHPGALVLHIIPLATVGSVPRPVSIPAAHEQSALFRPMGQHGYSPSFNVDGFINTTSEGSYTQVFRDGRVEAVVPGMAVTTNGVFTLSAPRVENRLADGVPRYLQALDVIGVTPPFFLLISVLNVRTAQVSCERKTTMFWEPGPPLSGNRLELPAATVADMGAPPDYLQALKPALDALWNAGGHSEWTPAAK